MTLQRARTDQARLGRRRQLLDAAAARFDAAGFAATTMAEIATAAGLAKGTTYLYFRSKEELFLGLLLEALEEWRDAAVERVTGKEPVPEAIAAVLAATLAERPRLVRLLALRGPVLEPAAGAAAAERFRAGQSGLLEPLAAKVEAAFPTLTPGGGVMTIARLVALAVGFTDCLEPRSGRDEAVPSGTRESTQGRRFVEALSSSMELFFRAAAISATPPAP